MPLRSEETGALIFNETVEKALCRGFSWLAQKRYNLTQQKVGDRYTFPK